MEHKSIEQKIDAQREFFRTGATRSVSARILLLKKLYEAIRRNEQEILLALKTDLGKSDTEAYMTEVGLTLREISDQIHGVRKWAKPQKKRSWLANQPSKSVLIPEPYGVVLVMSPWNYPFMLCMEPMVGAVAAGNCCVVKPSAYTPATSAVVRKVIEEACPPEWVTVVEGGRAENTALLEQRFDYIFFTGGAKVGKQIMSRAAANLTPVTLELGGKSPCIIDDSADLKLAAKRIAFGKLINCGQTCIAPDYILVDKRVEQRFCGYLIEAIEKMYGANPMESEDYGKIVNEKHFDRLLGLMDEEKIIYGGGCDRSRLKIAPTVMTGVAADDPIMQEEIFGPILPVLAVETMIEAEDFVAAREKPLALYLFTRRQAVEERFVEFVSFGGGCINDTMMHQSDTHLPFGGVGNSGMGAYHGKYSFDTFSHYKSVLKKSTKFDLPLRYPPHNSKLVNRLIRLFLK